MSNSKSLYLIVCHFKSSNQALLQYLTEKPNTQLTQDTWLISVFRTPDDLQKELMALVVEGDAVFFQKVSDECRSIGFDVNLLELNSAIAKKITNL